MKEREEGRKERKRIIGRDKYFTEDLRWVRHENMKHEKWNMKNETWNMKHETWNMKIWNMKHETWNMKHENMKHETWNMKYETWNMKHETWKYETQIITEWANRNENKNVRTF